MLEFRRTMDPHSRDLVRDGRHIGLIHWHENSGPRLLLADAFVALDLPELRQCVEFLEGKDQ